ncbi:MAG: hypothetical protein NTW11_00305 [Candidatus Staskawiczbacteria bacterium]|nr:hypothetical protein [Candidatus Staskawiczbacteria bacterium]
MDFILKIQESAVSISRAIGYVIIDTTEKGEYNMVRKLAGDNYPRFHIYLGQKGGGWNFSLHLDQKKPVYEGSGSHAHNGEYFGPIIDGEVDRIKSALASSSSQNSGSPEDRGSGWDN